MTERMREAERFIVEMLWTGDGSNSRPATEMLTEARNRGISERTLKRAKARLGVCSKRDWYHDKPRTWAWRMVFESLVRAKWMVE